LGLLTQGVGPKAKERLASELASGECRVVVGTHALIQENVTFKDLRLAVVDEQHKFGVRQRRFLQEKSAHPNLLVMTATPIPRTLALTLYGDLDISVMTERPSGRGRVETVWMGSHQRGAVDAFLKKELDAGRQAYVVYPAVKETCSGRMGSAQQGLEDLRRRLPGLEIGLLHGKMDAAEKRRIMRRFLDGKLRVLAATTVIEVGIDVPNAAVMIVENAERFGLSQLHQMRGRIGRGKDRSTCILISDSEEPAAQERLDTFTRMESGFDVAEEDLRLRGPGDVIGQRQHGIPQLRIGNLIRDLSILEAARTEAFRIVEGDPDLSRPEHRMIREEIAARFCRPEPPA